LFHRSPKSPASIVLPVQIGSNSKKKKTRSDQYTSSQARSVNSEKKKKVLADRFWQESTRYTRFRGPNAHDQTLLDVCLTKRVRSECFCLDTRACLSGAARDPSPSLRPTATAVPYRHSIILLCFLCRGTVLVSCVFLVFFQN
jgi:hypothetical protein